jgi:hypothetical protein
MATAITFPVQINPAASVLPALSVRRHRSSSLAESEADRADRRSAMRRHPSARPLAAPLAAPVTPPSGVSISCADCQFQGTAACDDCIVTFICGTEVRLRADEAQALTALQNAGLVPRSQHVAVRV